MAIGVGMQRGDLRIGLRVNADRQRRPVAADHAHGQQEQVRGGGLEIDHAHSAAVTAPD